MKRMITLSASRITGYLFRQIPSPGAVCPAMVTFPFCIVRFCCRSMIPLTANTIVRVSDWLSAQRRVPTAPLSASDVTV